MLANKFASMHYSEDVLKIANSSTILPMLNIGNALVELPPITYRRLLVVQPLHRFHPAQCSIALSAMVRAEDPSNRDELVISIALRLLLDVEYSNRAIRTSKYITIKLR